MLKATKLHERFLAIESDLNELFLERSQPIRGLLCGLLSRQHVLLLGPPGTAKSELAQTICARMSGANYFEWLLSRTAVPEELFGPISLNALENDSYRRVTSSKMPEAHITFLDEIFKCNTAVLNAVLPIINERTFYNDGQPTDVPLELCVGASNEFPAEKDELAAIWDRFTLRYELKYITQRQNFKAMLFSDSWRDIEGADVPTITLPELRTAQKDVRRVQIKHLMPSFWELRNELMKVSIVPSDRRWKWTVSVIKAHAWLEGHFEATMDDFAIVKHCLWNEPEDIDKVNVLVDDIVSGDLAALRELIDKATDIFASFKTQAENSVNNDSTQTLGVDTKMKLADIRIALEDKLESAKNRNRSTTSVIQFIADVTKMEEETNKICLGM